MRPLMRFFSRDKETATAAPADVPFESLRRSPRNERKKRGPLAASNVGFEAGAPIDPAQTTKTRARRRLIGAVALALAAIVLVPMLFDRAPVAPAGDLGLQIPDRDTPFEGRRGVPDAAKGPLKPTGELPSLATPSSSTMVDATPGPTVESAAPVDSAVEPASKTPPPSKAADKPAAKVADKPKASEPASTDDPRAIAALEGRPEAAAQPDANRSYGVQVAAFSAADKAKGLRDQLVANGLRSYTESVSTAQGLRTRVRLGPFPSREAAEKARQKLKTMKLDGSVVPL